MSDADGAMERGVHVCRWVGGYVVGCGGLDGAGSLHALLGMDIYFLHTPSR